MNDVCKNTGVTTGDGTDRADDCPSGTTCKNPGGVGPGGEVPWRCIKDRKGCPKDMKKCPDNSMVASDFLRLS